MAEGCPGSICNRDALIILGSPRYMKIWLLEKVASGMEKLRKSRQRLITISIKQQHVNGNKIYARCFYHLVLAINRPDAILDNNPKMIGAVGLKPSDEGADIVVGGVSKPTWCRSDFLSIGCCLSVLESYLGRFTLSIDDTVK